MRDVNALSFEAAYSELETIIAGLEAGDLPLEETMALYERGRLLSRRCQDLLDAAELRIQQIDAEGTTRPL